MRKVVKVTEKLVKEEEVVYLCDCCKGEMPDPKKYGNDYYKIVLEDSVNYPECEGYGHTIELCEECYTYLSKQLLNTIKDYGNLIDIEDGDKD